MQVVSLETDIETRPYFPNPSLVDPFEREANGQRGPARGAWSDLVASNQAGTRFGSVYGGDPAAPWGSPNRYQYTGWLEQAWLQGWLADRGRARYVLEGGCVMEYTQLERPNVGRTFEGMERVTNPNAWREVLSIHSSDDPGDNTAGGGGESCIVPTGSEAKSDRTAKGSEAIKSWFHMDEKGRCRDRIERGNVAPATGTQPMRNIILGNS